jgi:hypothetical protein
MALSSWARASLRYEIARASLIAFKIPTQPGHTDGTDLKPVGSTRRVLPRFRASARSSFPRG